MCIQLELVPIYSSDRKPSARVVKVLVNGRNLSRGREREEGEEEGEGSSCFCKDSTWLMIGFDRTFLLMMTIIVITDDSDDGHGFW